MKSKFIVMISAILFISVIQKSYAQTDAGYRILNTFHIGGDGGWDYIAVNHDMNRIYVAHSTLVNIIDENTGKTIGVIPNTAGVHGIAFATPFDKGFTSNGAINSVTVFDLKTNNVIEQIKTGTGPDAIIYDTYSKKIFVCDGKGKEATIIDPSTDKVIDSIPLGGKPETPISDNAGNIYVNIEDKNELVHIDANIHKIVNRWTIGKGDSPSGLALDREYKRLFIGCSNNIVIIMNATDGNVIAQLPIGNGCDGIDFDAGTGNAFSSNGEGTLTVIHEDNPNTFRVVANLPTKKGARTSTIDEQTHHLFLPTADFGETPKADSEHPHPRPKVIDDTFEVLEVGK
jgi:YVTN family beta-propeller protein